MSDLVILVIDDPEKTDEVLNAWYNIGVPGATILDSTGMARRISGLGARDDLPLIPSLASLLQSSEVPHRTLFTVVPDGFDIQQLVDTTETITGKMDAPNTGILFVIPVKQAWGLRKQSK